MNTKTVIACATMIAFMMAPAGAQQAIKGNIASIDEPAGDIYIYPVATSTVGSNGAVNTDRYKVSDGLLFNAVHPGDRVSFSFEMIDGVKTIAKLEKE
jgi:Cu/Ag efflux protein CusF